MNTEEEARQKWCSETGERKYVAESLGELQRQCCCIASECMMWRWKRGYEPTKSGGMALEKVSTTGYCGLAGESK